MAAEAKLRFAPQGLSLLLRRLTIAACVSIVIIIGGGGYGIYRIYYDHILHDAEEEAGNLGKVLIASQHDLLLARGEDGRIRLFIDPGNHSLLDHRLRLFLKPFQIVKI